MKGVDGVIFVVFQGFDHGLRHHDGSGEMDHAFNIVLPDGFFHQGGVLYIAQDELTAQYAFAVAGGEVIVNDGIQAFVAQVPYDMTADISGTACYQDIFFIHDSISFTVFDLDLSGNGIITC